MSKKLYAERDPEKLEPYYSRHMEALDKENQLITDSAVAAELAYRDEKIDKLERMLNMAEGLMSGQEYVHYLSRCKELYKDD